MLQQVSEGRARGQGGGLPAPCQSFLLELSFLKSFLPLEKKLFFFLPSAVEGEESAAGGAASTRSG